MEGKVSRVTVGFVNLAIDILKSSRQILDISKPLSLMTAR